MQQISSLNYYFTQPFNRQVRVFAVHLARELRMVMMMETNDFEK